MAIVMKAYSIGVIWWMFFVIISRVAGQVYNLKDSRVLTANNTAVLRDEIADMKGLFEQLVEALVNNLTANGHNVGSECLNDTMVVIEGVLHRDTNAIRFLDADSKPGGGILDGNLVWTGDYTECVSISARNVYRGTEIAGKYFPVLLTPSFTQGAPLVLGVCLPNTCDEADARSLMTLITGQPRDTAALAGVFDVEKPPMSPEATAAIAIALFIVVIVIIGTAIDVFEEYSNNSYSLTNEDIGKSIEDVVVTTESTYRINGPVHDKGENRSTKHGVLRALKAFSVLTNTKKLMNTSTANGPLACLNGLRVISICWVIQGHTYELSIPFFSNMKQVQGSLAKRFTFQAMLNATYSVDTFFFMSGLLVAFLALKEMKSKGKLNWWYYFGHRFWRLTPMYAFLLFCFTALTPLLVSGPFRWLITEPKGILYTQIDKCRHYWWSNMLYFNNLFPDYGSLTGCMPWTWYLANDMQFYVFIAPLVLYLLQRNRLIGLAYAGLLIVGGVAIRAGIVTHYDMNQFARASKHLDSPWVKYGPIYQYPFTRWSVYVVGLVTGYILHRCGGKPRLNKLNALIGWIISTGVALSLVYGLYPYYNQGTNMSAFGSRLYLATNRTAWSLCLSWLVIVCASGRGGWVNGILSWRLWAPLGRLTYAAYLLHPIVIVVFWGNQLSTVPFTDMLAVFLFIGNVVITYGLSYIVSMVIEAPMMQLEKIILGR